MSARRRQLAPLQPVPPCTAPAEEQPANSLSEFCSAEATLVILSAVSGHPAAECILTLVVCALSSSGVLVVPFGESSSLESLRPCNIRMRFALTNKQQLSSNIPVSQIIIILGAHLKINGPEINVLHINRIRYLYLKEAIIT
jgi:hypothetical protein